MSYSSTLLLVVLFLIGGVEFSSFFVVVSFDLQYVHHHPDAVTKMAMSIANFFKYEGTGRTSLECAQLSHRVVST